MALAAAGPLCATGAPGDLVFERKGDASTAQAFPPSVFPHWVHRVRYRCDACHDRLFPMQAGASEVTMEQIRKEESCGACHNGKQAFDDSFENCSRCHRPPAE
jgi:c(7)-type cytochrome triheme protein